MSLDKRLRKLETPTRLEHLYAKERAMAHTIRSFGAVLESHEEHILRPGYDEQDFNVDCGVLARYRASLDPERRKLEQHGLMRELFEELERRGIDTHMDEDDRDLE